MERDLWRDGEEPVGLAPRGRSHARRRWIRQWRFFIWTWTIRSDSEDLLVEMVQRRFLGEEAVRRFSRKVWLLMAWTCVVFLAVAAVIYIVLIYLMSISSGADQLLALEISLLLLPVVLFVATVVYFTFVPPKGKR